MKRISQRDIARKLGINVSTVSRALRGLRIPDDIAIIAYMSDWVSEMSHPRTSFVKQNLTEIGTKAFRLLLDQINGDDSVQHIVVTARLELRNSTKKR